MHMVKAISSATSICGCSKKIASYINNNSQIMGTTSFYQKLEKLCAVFGAKFISICESLRVLFNQVCLFIVFHVHPFWHNLFYILIVSVLGFLSLKGLPPRIQSGELRMPNDFDLYFTSVSAVTSSSMSVVDMEVFSDNQVVIITVLMLLGGQVFISMLQLLFRRAYEFPKSSGKSDFSSAADDHNPATEHYSNSPVSSHSLNHPNHTPSCKNEIGLLNLTHFNGIEKPCNGDVIDLEKQARVLASTPSPYTESNSSGSSNTNLKYNAIKSLSYIVFGYLLMSHLLGSSFLSMYMAFVPSVYNVLKSKGLHLQTFSVFLTVSTFANCGFLPNNENMFIFRENSGLLLILMPQILLGNTLYAPSLRFVIWVLEKLFRKREFRYMLENDKELDFDHLVSGFESVMLCISTSGIILLQFVMFCIMEWGGSGDGTDGTLDGMNPFQKVIASFFQAMNSRHTGESVVDLSAISPAMLVLFVVIMYLPSYTVFNGQREDVSTNIKRRQITIHDDQQVVNQIKTPNMIGNLMTVQNVLFSQLTYIAIFVILICITERDKLKQDPLNFTIFNIIVEVISAYGNVGFSTCYSCKRRLDQTQACTDAWYGFSGHWSNHGKFLLIVVMIFGKLKKFNLQGGKAWKLG